MRSKCNEKIVDNKETLFRNEPSCCTYRSVLEFCAHEDTNSSIPSICWLDALMVTVVSSPNTKLIMGRVLVVQVFYTLITFPKHWRLQKKRQLEIKPKWWGEHRPTENREILKKVTLRDYFSGLKLLSQISHDTMKETGTIMDDLGYVFRDGKISYPQSRKEIAYTSVFIYPLSNHCNVSFTQKRFQAIICGCLDCICQQLHHAAHDQCPLAFKTLQPLRDGWHSSINWKRSLEQFQ